jgi:hypothetical protein
MSQETRPRKHNLTQPVLIGLMVLAIMGAWWLEVPWARALLMLVAALATCWIVLLQAKKQQIPGEDWCYFLYAFGAISCVIAFFPPPELAEMQVRQGETWTSLYLGLVLILIGGLVHATLIYRGRASKENAKKWALILCALVPCAIAYGYLNSKGYRPWVFFSYLFLITVIAVVILIAVYFMLSRRIPINRMARLIGKKRYREAIELAESLPPDARRPEVQYNVAVAYKLMGENIKARELFEQLQTHPDVPEVIAEAIKMRLAELTRQGQPS